MESDHQQRLIEKLQRIEALFADRAATLGERSAAGEARERILKRLAEYAQIDPPIEYRFSLGNSWSKKLFIALLRRYNIRPYRYARQRYTTVMARIPKGFVDETLWPEFRELDATLSMYLSETTDKIISQGVHGDSSDVEIVAGTELPETAGLSG